MYHRIKRRECLLIDNSYQFYSDMGNLKYRAFKFWKMNGNKLEGKFLLSCLGLMAKLCLKPYMGGTLTIHGGRMRKLRPCLFFVLFFLISHSFLNSIISCIFKNKIVSRKWIGLLVSNYPILRLLAFFGWTLGSTGGHYILAVLPPDELNVKFNTNIECWLSGKSMEIWFQTKFRMKICLHSTILGEKGAIKKIMMLCENCSKFALLCILVGVLASRRIVKLSKASGWYWHTINLKGLPTLP